VGVVVGPVDVVGVGFAGVTGGADGSVVPFGTDPVGITGADAVGAVGAVGTEDEAVVGAEGRTSSIRTRGPHPPSNTTQSIHTRIIAQEGKRFRFVFMSFATLQG